MEKYFFYILKALMLVMWIFWVVADVKILSRAKKAKVILNLSDDDYFLNFLEKICLIGSRHLSMGLIIAIGIILKMIIVDVKLNVICLFVICWVLVLDFIKRKNIKFMVHGSIAFDGIRTYNFFEYDEHLVYNQAKVKQVKSETNMEAYKKGYQLYFKNIERWFGIDLFYFFCIIVLF